MLAGVSAGYYTRIEQGQAADASPAVLLAIARALRMDPLERDHLLALAAPEASTVRDYVPEVVSDALIGLLRSMGEVAGVVMGRHLDLLAWTPLAHALIGSHLDFESVDDASVRPNWARMIFTDGHVRALLVDWAAKCWDVAGYLRVQAGKHPHDGRLGALVGELCLTSTAFDEMWTSRRVKDESTPECVVRHPTLGELELRHVPLLTADGSDQMVATFYAVPGTESAAVLADVVASHREPPRRVGRPGSLTTRSRRGRRVDGGAPAPARPAGGRRGPRATGGG